MLQFDLGVFPCLRLKDLLRLRRVCKFTKGLSEDYLRKHPDSSNCIQIFNEKDAGDTRSLESFLLQDGANSIRKPTRTLKLFFSKDQKIFGHPGLPEFLEKYGSQIESLHVSYLSIPMGEDEWRFYEGLPKLKSLMFEFHVAPDLASDAVIAFPGTFKNLTTFKVLGSGQADISKFYWTLVDHCTNLETIDFDGTLYSGPHHLKELLRILEQKAHKNLKFCMIWLYFYIEFADPSTSNSQLLPLCEKYKLKFTGFHVNKLSAFEKSRRQVISEAISTLLWRPGENCELSEDTPLPNVEKIYMCMKSKFLPLINKGSGQFVDAAAGENLRRSLSPVIFPNLKKLEVGLCDRLSDPSVMTHMWGWLPNLEEIVFGSTKCLKNVFFLGFKKELPFLLLTSKRTLNNAMNVINFGFAA